MTDKYETVEILKGNEILDIPEWFRKQEDNLHNFKQAFNDKTAADEKFFKGKEMVLSEQRILVETWLKELGFKNAMIGNYTIKLVVSKGEGK